MIWMETHVSVLNIPGLDLFCFCFVFIYTPNCFGCTFDYGSATAGTPCLYYLIAVLAIFCGLFCFSFLSLVLLMYVLLIALKIYVFVPQVVLLGMPIFLLRTIFASLREENIEVISSCCVGRSL